MNDAARTGCVDYRTPAREEGPALAAMARQCFVETFGHLYDSAELDPFLDQAYGPQGLLAELDDPQTEFRIAHRDEAVVGYAKLSPLCAPAAGAQPGALELRQIYVLAEWQGAGVAPALMEWAVARATARGAPELYLTVFDHNHRAKRFYARYGFSESGRCTFRMGSRVDDDRIWRKPLGA
ncbi:N-acetyltransferase family protein [Rhodanobacter sp. Si-c]|uniref:N-acetyltransferase family protein n=1 Tax=Rhodanobacter lycopersici TaxID=3162487 RepID=A0ABV3QAX4_9GAMM